MSLLAALGVPLGYGLLLWFLGAAVVWLARPRLVPAALAGVPVAVALVALTAWGQLWGSYTFGWPTVGVSWCAAGAVALVVRWLTARRIPAHSLQAGDVRAGPSLSVWRDAVPTGISASFTMAGSMALGLLVLWWAGGGS